MQVRNGLLLQCTRVQATKERQQSDVADAGIGLFLTELPEEDTRLRGVQHMPP
jgi:hypothetical protein